MPATNLEELFDFAEAFETAAEIALKKINPEIPIVIPRSADKLPKERVEITFEVGEALQSARCPNGGIEYFRFAGTLAVRVVTDRLDDNPDVSLPVRTKHAKYLAQARVCMLSTGVAFIEEDLPWYGVVTVPRPLAVLPDSDPDRYDDSTTLSFALEFEIRDSAWPVA